MTYIIRDWANNPVFNDIEFKTFELADNYLEKFIATRFFKCPLDDVEWSKNEKAFYSIKDEYWIRNTNELGD